MGSFTSAIIKHFEEEYRFEEHYRNRPPIKPLESLSRHQQVKMNFHQPQQQPLHNTTCYSRKNSLGIVSTSISSSNTSSTSSTSSISNSTLRHASSRMSKYFISSDDSNNQNISPGPGGSGTIMRKSSKPDLYKKILSPVPIDIPEYPIEDSTSDNSSHSLQKQNSLPCLKPNGCDGLKEKTLTKSRSMREKGLKQIRFADEPEIMMERVASADSRAEMMFSKKMVQQHDAPSSSASTASRKQ